MTEVNIFSNKTWDLSFLTSQQKCGRLPFKGHVTAVEFGKTPQTERERRVCGAQVVPLKYLLLDFKASRVV